MNGNPKHGSTASKCKVVFSRTHTAKQTREDEQHAFSYHAAGSSSQYRGIFFTLYWKMYITNNIYVSVVAIINIEKTLQGKTVA
jgi:type VI protein secretion system component VasF